MKNIDKKQEDKKVSKNEVIDTNKELVKIESNEKRENIEEKLLELLKFFEKQEFIDVINIMGSTKRYLWRNFLSGIVKGVGIGIGLTIVTAIMVIILQNIVELNIPVISDYIVQIIDIVEKRI